MAMEMDNSHGGDSSPCVKEFLNDPWKELPFPSTTFTLSVNHQTTVDFSNGESARNINRGPTPTRVTTSDNSDGFRVTNKVLLRLHDTNRGLFWSDVDGTAEDFIAASIGHDVQFMIREGYTVDGDGVPKELYTFAQFAIKNNHLNALREIVLHNPNFNLNWTDNIFGFIAQVLGDVDNISFGSIVPVAFTQPIADTDEWNQQRLPMLQFLLKQGASPNRIWFPQSFVPSFGYLYPPDRSELFLYPVYTAASSDNLSACQVLLEFGADVNAANELIFALADSDASKWGESHEKLKQLSAIDALPAAVYDWISFNAFTDHAREPLPEHLAIRATIAEASPMIPRAQNIVRLMNSDDASEQLRGWNEFCFHTKFFSETTGGMNILSALRQKQLPAEICRKIVCSDWRNIVKWEWGHKLLAMRKNTAAILAEPRAHVHTKVYARGGQVKCRFRVSNSLGDSYAGKKASVRSLLASYQRRFASHPSPDLLAP